MHECLNSKEKMNKNIAKAFEQAEKNNSAVLIGFVTGYCPDYETSKLILKTMAKYCSIIEVGVPFNTSTSDSAIIMEANDRAIANGATTEKVLKLIKEVKSEIENPPAFITMGYLNNIFQKGVSDFITKAKTNHIDGCIFVDANLGSPEDSELFEECNKNDIGYIKLVTPTNDESYIKDTLKKCNSWIYVVSYAGVTGIKKYNAEYISKSVQMIRKNSSDIKIGVGFGIKTQDDVKEVSKYANAVIVGSGIVKHINEGITKKLDGHIIAKNIGLYLSDLSKGLKK